MGVPTDAAITGTWIGIIVIVLATFVLDAVIDVAFGVPRVPAANVPFGAITLITVFVFETTRPQTFVFFDGGVIVANTGRIVEFLWYVDIAITEFVAFRSTTAITDLFTFVVPRDATFVIDVRVRHARRVILVLDFANESVRAFGVLDAQTRRIMRRFLSVVVMTSFPCVTFRRVILFGDVSHPRYVPDLFVEVPIIEVIVRTVALIRDGRSVFPFTGIYEVRFRRDAVFNDVTTPIDHCVERVYVRTGRFVDINVWR